MVSTPPPQHSGLSWRYDRRMRAASLVGCGRYSFWCKHASHVRRRFFLFLRRQSSPRWICRPFLSPLPLLLLLLILRTSQEKCHRHRHRPTANVPHSHLMRGQRRRLLVGCQHGRWRAVNPCRSPMLSAHHHHHHHRPRRRASSSWEHRGGR